MPAQETQTKGIVLEALAAHYTCTEKLPAKDPNVRSFEAKSPELNYFFDEINNYFIHMIVQIGKSKFTSPVSVSPSDLVQTIRALDQLNRIRRLCPKGKPQWIKHYALTFASHPGSPMLQFTFSKPGLCLVRRPTAINRLRHAETTKSFEVGTLDQTIIQEIISGYNSSMRNWKAEAEKWNLQHGAALDAKMFLCPAYIYFKTSSSGPICNIAKQVQLALDGSQTRLGTDIWNGVLPAHRNELALLLQHLDQFP
jgi:hypothetical protein